MHLCTFTSTETNPGQASNAVTCRRHDSWLRQASTARVCNLCLALGTDDLLTCYFFPAEIWLLARWRPRFPPTAGLVARVTPCADRAFRRSGPSGFLFSSLLTLCCNRKVLSLWGTSGAWVGAVQVGVSPPCCCPGPCWESSILSMSQRQCRQEGEWGVRACFPATSPTRGKKKMHLSVSAVTEQDHMDGSILQTCRICPLCTGEVLVNSIYQDPPPSPSQHKERGQCWSS